LLKILGEIGLPFCVCQDGEAQNISVRLNKGDRYFIVAAHYDVCDDCNNSTGANDNASGVAVLLALLKRYRRRRPKVPLEFVFFDLEERTKAREGQYGSRRYVERIDRKEIKGMINLDMCGIGEMVVLGPRKNARRVPWREPMKGMPKSSSDVVDCMPKSDDRSFEAKKIPNISICILPKDDFDLFQSWSCRPTANRPSIRETMHGGKRDSVREIQEDALTTVFTWVSNFVGLLGGESC
jgi:Iap family predicted aminopeptidase